MLDNNRTTCPCCNKVANEEKEIEEKFGYRNMGDGRIIPQSYCKRCRSAQCRANDPKH